MRARIAFLLLVLVLTAPTAAQQHALRRTVQHSVLENGLDVVVVENHAVALATVLVAVRNGAFAQAAGEAGLAHLQEHVLFRGFDGSPSAFGQDVASLDGMHNGSTAEEVMTFYVIVPSENTEKAIRLLAELIPKARVGPLDLTDERPVVLDELARDEADPERRLQRRVGQELWGEAWHRKDVIGDTVSLERVTVDRLKDAFARYYVPNNSALVVTGDVSPSDVAAAAERYFGGWTRGPDPFAGLEPAPVSSLTGPRLVTLSEPVPDVSIIVEYPGPSVRADTADTYAVDALVEILNDPTSRFQKQLVATGPFEYLYASFRTLREGGPITIAGKASPERGRQAVSDLLSALEQQEMLLGIPEEDLAIARRQKELSAALALEETATLAPSLAYWWATAGVESYLGYRDRLDQQTPEDLQRVAERYVIGRPRVVGLLGPPEAIETIAAYLQRIIPGLQ